MKWIATYKFPSTHLQNPWIPISCSKFQTFQDNFSNFFHAKKASKKSKANQLVNHGVYGECIFYEKQTTVEPHYNEDLGTMNIT